jgi:hypothetical protein
MIVEAEIDMSIERHDCPKCKAPMEEGFIADYRHGWANRIQSRWVEGSPVPSFWLGLTFKGRRTRNVTAYRCVTCGFLEAFAK